MGLKMCWQVDKGEESHHTEERHCNIDCATLEKALHVPVQATYRFATWWLTNLDKWANMVSATLVVIWSQSSMQFCWSNMATTCLQS